MVLTQELGLIVALLLGQGENEANSSQNETTLISTILGKM